MLRRSKPAGKPQPRRLFHVLSLQRDRTLPHVLPDPGLDRRTPGAAVSPVNKRLGVATPRFHFHTHFPIPRPIPIRPRWNIAAWPTSRTSPRRTILYPRRSWRGLATSSPVRPEYNPWRHACALDYITLPYLLSFVLIPLKPRSHPTQHTALTAFASIPLWRCPFPTGRHSRLA